MKLPRRYFLLTVIFVSMLGLSSCAKRPCDISSQRERAACLLRSQKIDVLPAGETVKIILPSDQLFVNDTTEFTEHYKPILAATADFIRSFSVITVQVTGYTDAIDPPIQTKGGSFSEELTRSQADAVASYLWKHKINTRLLLAAGKDGRHKVAWNGSRIGRQLNRRIEITFRYYRNNKAWY